MEISNALDAENTEQDVSAAAESLENLAENDAGVGNNDNDNALEDIIDQHSQVGQLADPTWYQMMSVFYLMIS